MQNQTADNEENINENENQEESKKPLEKSGEEDKTFQDDDGGRWKAGDILNMVRVRFPGNAKSFPFLVGKRNFNYGQRVVAMSDRGMTIGYINSFPYEVNFETTMMPVRSIQRIANDEDFEKQKEHMEKEVDAEILCKELIEKHKLDMILTHVEFIQFGKKAVFYFIAPARVDFRGLVKDLVSELRMRIELRQISVRDRTAALGAIASCGLQTCCSSFLKNYGDVSIKMAKNQDLALIPSKINGVCGQLKCCIKYEDHVYHDKKKKLPKEGNFLKVKNNDIGKVLKVYVLTEQFVLLTDTGKKKRYAINQLLEDSSPPESWKFPEQFRHIVDETKTVIGLTDEAQKMADDFLSGPDSDYEEIDLSGIENEELLEIEKSTKKFKWDDKSNDSKLRPAADPTFKTKNQNTYQEIEKKDTSNGLLEDTGSKRKPRKRRNRYNRNKNKPNNK